MKVIKYSTKGASCSHETLVPPLLGVGLRLNVWPLTKLATGTHRGAADTAGQSAKVGIVHQGSFEGPGLSGSDPEAG